MRLSVDKDDPAYDPELGFKVYVKLNGEKIEDCITADEELGIAICYAKDEENKLIIENDDIKRITLKGKVEIFIAEEVYDE